MTTEAEGQCQRDNDDVSLLAVRIEEGPCAKECGQPLEAGKGKEMDSPTEPPEGTLSC